MVNNERKRYLLLLLFAALYFIPSPVWAQDQKVILPARELTVKTALGQIEKQTSYKVAVNWDNVDAQKKVLFPASQLTVKEVLDKALAGSGCRWEIAGNQVAIVCDNSGKDEMYPVYSAMNRNRLPSQMKIVPDPWSSRQLSADDMSRIRSGFWRSGGDGTDSISLAILNFRVVSTTLERDYMDNARTLDLIHRTFSDKDALAAMDFITITSAASPEGNTARNEQLAAGRALAVKSYIMWKYPFMNRERIFTFSIGEDWTGLRKMVKEDPGVPYRNEVLNILDSDNDSDAKRSMLKQLGSGSAYRYILQNMLPKLRGAAACMIYYKENPKPIIITEKQTDTVYIDREKIVEREKVVEVPSTIIIGNGQEDNGLHVPYWFGIKTNLLYDAALLPDLGVEFALGRKWSFELNAQWAWWNTPVNHNNCWRIQIASVDVRRYLGDRDKRTPLSGWYLGLNGMAGTYDIRFNGKTGRLSNMSYSAGIAGGYSLPIARSWNIDFGLALGYVGGRYDTYHYDPTCGNVFPRERINHLHYFGPTRARIAIMWLPWGKNWAKNEPKKK